MVENVETYLDCLMVCLVAIIIIIIITIIMDSVDTVSEDIADLEDITADSGDIIIIRDSVSSDESFWYSR